MIFKLTFQLKNNILDLEINLEFECQHRINQVVCAVCCSVLQCIVVCVAVHCSRSIAAYCSVLQRIAVLAD